jgi:hypothetical protein
MALPQGFVRIRHFGFLACRRPSATLPLCFQLLGAAQETLTEEHTSSTTDQLCGMKLISPTPTLRALSLATLLSVVGKQILSCSLFNDSFHNAFTVAIFWVSGVRPVILCRAASAHPKTIPSHN